MEKTEQTAQLEHSDVRRFFCNTYAKWRSDSSMDALETIASLWMAEHAEFHAVLADIDAALLKDFAQDETNPFLHLAMHLALSEQVSIDQPRGVRAVLERLTQKEDDLHAAHHIAFEALGTMLQTARSRKSAPVAADAELYLEHLRRLLG